MPTAQQIAQRQLQREDNRDRTQEVTPDHWKMIDESMKRPESRLLYGAKRLSEQRNAEAKDVRHALPVRPERLAAGMPPEERVADYGAGEHRAGHEVAEHRGDRGAGYA